MCRRFDSGCSDLPQLATMKTSFTMAAHTGLPFCVKDMNEQLLQWIRQLIRNNNLHEFYTSPLWRRKQAEILKRDHHECSRCKVKGLVVHANTVHHKKYLRRYPELAFDDDNLESICERCHYDEHHRKKQGFMNEERW